MAAYGAFSPDVMTAMLVYSQQKNFDSFFSFREPTWPLRLLYFVFPEIVWKRSI